MASLRNPAPGHASYLHDGAPGKDCGTQAGQPPYGAIGGHPDQAEPPIEAGKTGSSAKAVYGAQGEMASIGGSKPSGPKRNSGVQSNLSGKANPSFGKPANRDAGRGNPA